MTISANHDPGDVAGEATFVLRAEYAELARLSRWIGDLGERWALSPHLQYRFDLAFTEFVTNVLEHGTLDRSGAGIQITARLMQVTIDGEQQRHLVATIVDGSAPFNPLDVAAPSRSNSLDEAPIGGLGIHLARTACDQCRYEFVDGKNILTMLFKDGASV